MRIPPFYRLPNVQRFFFGIVIGGIISWCIFLFMYGSMQEDQVRIIRQQEETIADLTKEKDIWQEDFKKLNEKNKELLTVQDISIQVTNAKKYKIDPLSIMELKEEIKEDIDMLLAKDLQVVYSSSDLIEKVIENKTRKIIDRSYNVKIKKILFYTTIKIDVELTLVK